MDRSTRVTEITAAQSVQVTYAKAEETLRIRPSHLVEVALSLGTAQRCERGLGVAAPPSPPGGSDARTSRVRDRWHCSHSVSLARSLFPALVPEDGAEISVHASGPSASEIVLKGSYVPPLGLIGLVANQLVGVTAAQSTAEQFLGELGRAIENDAPAR